MKRILTMLPIAAPLLAQQGRGTISGTVTDATGATVPGATIIITNAATNAAFSTTTNELGYYRRWCF